MDEDLRYILMELEDKGFKVKYYKNEVIISSKSIFKFRDVRHALLRVFLYRDYKDVHLHISFKTKITGCVPMSMKNNDYKVLVDKSFYEGFCVQRNKYSDIPYYIKNNQEINNIKLLTKT